MLFHPILFHGFVWGLPEFSQYPFNFNNNNNHPLNVSVGPNNAKFFLFVALILPKIYDIILDLVFDPVEKTYLAFHNTFEFFPLVFIG